MGWRVFAGGLGVGQGWRAVKFCGVGSGGLWSNEGLGGGIMGRQGTRWHVRGFETAAHFYVTLLEAVKICQHIFENVLKWRGVASTR